MTWTQTIGSWICAGALTALVPGLGAAQEFVLPYNKTPETAPEFWAAAKYDMGLGNHQRAAQMLGSFYDKVMALGPEEQRKFFLAQYDTEGVSPLLKLGTLPAVRQVLRKDPATGKDRPAVDILIDKMTGFVDARLSNLERIRFFVGQLNGRPQERAYAISQLRASGPRSIGPMLEVLRDPGQAQLHGGVYSALLQMDRDIGPPLLRALDSKSEFVKATIVDAFVNRADARIVPDLHFLSASSASTPALKAKATSALARFLKKKEEDLPDARAALTAEAERYHQHQVEFGGERLTVWTWSEDQGLVGRPADASQVEEARGIAYARKALDLDPGYVPAQVVLLSIALDKLYERGGPSVQPGKADPALHGLLMGSPPGLLEEVLAKAIRDQRTNAALGAARAMGAHGDPSFVRATGREMPPLLQALRYPDRRVQFAAAEAALAIPHTDRPYPGNNRVVEVLRLALTGSGPGVALVGLGNREDANRLAGLLKPIGFEAQVVTSGKDLLNIPANEGNVGLVITDPALPNPGFSYLLSQYRENPATAGIPLLLIATGGQARYAQDETGSLPKVRIIPAAPQSREHDQAKPALTAEERAAQAKSAAEYLARMASGELKGYDLRPADAALQKALHDESVGATVAAALAYRPGREVQTALATAVLSEAHGPAFRSAIAPALRAHLQRFGNRLAAGQIQGLVKLAQSAADPGLREQAELIASSLKSDAAVIGQRLKGFMPSAAPVAPAPKVEPGK
jgi:hypothetical protein